MIQRTRKQISYAVGTLVVAGLCIGLLSLSGGNSGTVQNASPTPTPQFVAITVETTDVIRHVVPEGAVETIDIVARLKNPNAGAGIKSYPVTFALYEPSGDLIKRQTEEIYLLPGSVQYAIAINVALDRRTLGRVEVEQPANPQFITLPSTVNQPTFTSFARQRSEKQIGSQTIEEQVGIVKNTSTFSWQTVDVNVVGLSMGGKAIAAGKTSIGALAVGEEREFNVIWPKPGEAISRVIIVPATNMYRDENVIRIIGNPSLLK